LPRRHTAGVTGSIPVPPSIKSKTYTMQTARHGNPHGNLGHGGEAPWPVQALIIPSRNRIRLASDISNRSTGSATYERPLRGGPSRYGQPRQHPGLNRLSSETASWRLLTKEPNTDSSIADPAREPWNKGKLVGQKTPFKLKEIWAIRIRLQIANRCRDLALFNLAIDSKLRACDLVQLHVRDVCYGQIMASRALILQQRTSRPAQGSPQVAGPSRCPVNSPASREVGGRTLFLLPHNTHNCVFLTLPGRAP